MEFKSTEMNLNFSDSVGYLTFKALEKYDFVKHCFSTRLGGVSKNEFSSMNLSYGVNDIRENVDKNYDIFCDALGFSRENIVSSDQVHGNKIKIITENDVKNRRFNYGGMDGFVTNVPNIVLKTSHADCCPVYMLDTINKVVGLAHAGWRGTVAKIAENLAGVFVSAFGSEKSDIVCALGPAIGGCCFDVFEDVWSKFEDLNLGIKFQKSEKSEGKVCIDLEEVNEKILVSFGIDAKNIYKSRVCTSCHSDVLFSHRASKGKRGNNAAFISILK